MLDTEQGAGDGNMSQMLSMPSWYPWAVGGDRNIASILYCLTSVIGITAIFYVLNTVLSALSGFSLLLHSNPIR